MDNHENLVCTLCGSTLSPVMEHRGPSYVGYEVWVGTECDDCPALWNREGILVRTKWDEGWPL